MFYQTLLAAAVLAYIVCVLIMSGAQKEDLDANTLDKLRRHNVDLDDLVDLDDANLSNCVTKANTHRKITLTTETPHTTFPIEPISITVADSTQVNAYRNAFPVSSVKGMNSETDISKMETINRFWNVISDNLWKILPNGSENASRINPPATTNVKELNEKEKHLEDIQNHEIQNNEEEIFTYNPMIQTFFDESKSNKDNDNLTNNNQPFQNNEEQKTLRLRETTMSLIYFAHRKHIIRQPHENQISTNAKSKPEPDIFEIADKVKQLLLKDLKHDTSNNFSSTKTSIVTTTEIPTTVPTEKPLSIGDAKKVMDRFLHLCKHLKLELTTTQPLPITEKSIQFQPVETKVVDMNLINSIYGGGRGPKFLPLIQQPMDVIPNNPYYTGLPKPTNSYYPGLAKPIQQYNRPMASSMNTIYFKPQALSDKEIDFRFIPKTIQTNAGEIAPLVIPINVKGRPRNFMKLVENQNIVITPKSIIKEIRQNDRLEKEELSKQKIDDHLNRNPNNFKDKENKLTIHNKYDPKAFIVDLFEDPPTKSTKTTLRTTHKPHVDIKPKHVHFNYNNRENPKLRTNLQSIVHKPVFLEDSNKENSYTANPYERQKIKQGYINRNNVYDKTMMRSMETISNYRPGIRHQMKPNIESIREVLEQNRENVESIHNVIESFEKRKEDSDDYDGQINQRPLAPLNRLVDNDDTHFHNFIRTQQKVNDMLEQILSSNTKRLLSIETV